jgi:VWFA-related protein
MGLSVLKILILAGTLQAPAAAAPSPAATPLVFASEANLVHVDAVVVDKDGRQVTDLAPSDFVIEVDKKKYTPSIATYVPLADDATASTTATGGNVAGRVLAFLVAQPLILFEPGPGRDALDNRRPRLTAIHRVNRLLSAYVDRQFGPRDRAAVVNADHPKQVAIRFRDDRDDLSKDIDQLRDDALGSQRSIFLPASNAGPTVYSREVVRMARSVVDELQRFSGRRILVLVSSDLFWDSRADPLGAAGHDLVDAANRAGVTIYGISPAGGMSGFSEVLGALAHDTGGSTVQGTNDVESGFQKIMELNRGYYLLGYDTGKAPSKSAHSVKVEVLRRDVTVAARPLVFDRGGSVMASRRPSAFAEVEKERLVLDTYLVALSRYRATFEVGRPPEAWTDPELKRFSDYLSKDPSLFDIETAMLMHLAREMAARDESDGTGASACNVGQDARVFDRLAAIARGNAMLRPFAIRFHVAASFRYRSMHCYAHAWYWAEEGRKAFPDDATLTMTRGLVDEALGSQSQQPAVDLGSFIPGQPRSRADSPASIAFRRERLKAARDMFERAVQKAPESVEARLHYGRILFRLGEHQRARVVLEETAARAEDRTLYLSHLFAGEAIEALGDIQAALPHYKAAFTLFPFSKTAAIALSYAHSVTGSADEAEAVLRSYLQNADRNRYLDPALVYLSGIRSEADEFITTNLRAEARR